MFSPSNLIDHIVSELVRGQISPQEVSLVPHHNHRHVRQTSGHGYLVPGNVLNSIIYSFNDEILILS